MAGDETTRIVASSIRGAGWFVLAIPVGAVGPPTVISPEFPMKYHWVVRFVRRTLASSEAEPGTD